MLLVYLAGKEIAPFFFSFFNLLQKLELNTDSTQIHLQPEKVLVSNFYKEFIKLQKTFHGLFMCFKQIFTIFLSVKGMPQTWKILKRKKHKKRKE